MPIVTISSKRQITLPKKLLDETGIKPKSKVIISKGKNSLYLQPAKTSIVDELGGSLRKYIHPSKLGKSVREIKKEVDEILTEQLAKKYKDY